MSLFIDIALIRISMGSEVSVPSGENRRRRLTIKFAIILILKSRKSCGSFMGVQCHEYLAVVPKQLVVFGNS